MTPQRSPVVTDEMLAWLDSLFPDQAPSLQDSDREVWFKAGQANVVERLRKEQERQRKP